MTTDHQPNILVIMTDQHNKHALGCYGNSIVRTPNLDRLAAQGLRFDDAYCPAPLCVPSRMSFMTARHPYRNQVWTNGHILSSGAPTWAHVLGAAGYETSLIGRMHFVGSDQRHGFENRPIGEYWAKHAGAPTEGGPWWTRWPIKTAGQCREAVELVGTGTSNYAWADEQVTLTACQYLRKHAARPGRPFAACVGYLLPHSPYIAPKELFDYYYDVVDVPQTEAGQPELIREWRQSRGLTDPPLSEEQVRKVRAAYFGMCEHIDGMIGQILNCLEETGLAEDTLVLYTSDHGDCAGEHGCFWKTTYYEGSAGVPLIARLPGILPEGAASGVVCNLIDLGPTLAEVGGSEMRFNVDGRSLWPIMQQPVPERGGGVTYSEVPWTGSDRGRASRMIRSGPWKLWAVFGEDGTAQTILHNLDEDPGETNDLSDDSAHQDVKGSLLTRLLEEWQPDAVTRGYEEASRAAGIIGAWGRAVKPRHPDALPAPPPEVEADVKLL